jgi:hypothetical protein
MVEDVTMVGPDTGVVGIEDNLDCRFRGNQYGIAFRADDFFTINFGNFEDVPMQVHGVRHPVVFEMTSSTRSPSLILRLFLFG